MNTRTVVVIGGGPGGYVAAIRAAQMGAKVTLVERDKIGGTCLNKGCIPTKALLSDVKLLRSLRRSIIFKAMVPAPFDPLKSMMDRKKSVVEEMRRGVEMLLRSQKVDIKYGHADLLSPNLVVVSREGENEKVEADSIILAPGARSQILPGISFDGERVISSDEALELKKVPQEMVIVGGGYIGTEFAAIFSVLGAKVTIVEALESILPGNDGEITGNLRRCLEKDGVRILTRSKVEDIRDTDEGLALTVRTPKEVQTLSAQKLLLAVGRRPNLDLNFSKVGVEVSSSGIRVNDRMQTAAPSIYAVGDAVGGALLAYVASEQGEVAAENIMGGDRRMDHRPIPCCVFTHPEVATIGLTEKEARDRREVKVGRFPFNANPRALTSGETEGLVKVIADRRTDEILGVHIIGVDAGVLISIASSIMNQGGKVKDFTRLTQIHPTTPEALREALLDTDGSAIHLPKKIANPRL